MASSALSPRQRRVLTLAARGLTDEAIAARLGIATGTMREHWRRVTAKYGTPNRTAAVLEAIRRGEIRVAGVVGEGVFV